MLFFFCYTTHGVFACTHVPVPWNRARSEGGRASAKQLDVTSESGVNAVADEIVAEYGKIDVLGTQYM